MPIFNETALRKLENLSLVANSVRVGGMKGDRHSRKRGSAIEFADYREYSPGDDLRRIDWNVLARLDRPFIKLTEEEEELVVHIMVDTSTSMDWPPANELDDSPTNKLRYAILLAGALGYLGLSSGDLVNTMLFNQSGTRSWGPFRGRKNGWPLLEFLEANYNALSNQNNAPPRLTSLESALYDYAQQAKRPGLLLLLSDMLTPQNYATGLSTLLARGHQVTLLHIQSPDELAPNYDGDLKLIDVETGEAAEITIDPMVLEAYSARFDEWRSGIVSFCETRNINYISISTEIPWDKLVMEFLREQGIVR